MVIFQLLYIYELLSSTRADGHLLPTSRRQEVTPNGTLILDRVDSNTDRGAYTCTAKNKQGRSDSKTVRIDVKGKHCQLFFFFTRISSPYHLP